MTPRRGGKQGQKGREKGRAAPPASFTPPGDPEPAPPEQRVRKGKLEIRAQDAGGSVRWLDAGKHAPAARERARIPTKTVNRARELFLAALELQGDIATGRASRTGYTKDGTPVELGPTFSEMTAAASELRRAGYGDRLHVVGEGGDASKGPTAFTVVVMTGQPQHSGPLPAPFIQVATLPPTPEPPQ